MLLPLRYLSFGFYFSKTSKIEQFVSASSEDLLDIVSKDKLLEPAAHYEINLSSQDKRLKDSIKTMIKTGLLEHGVLASQLSIESSVSDRSSV